VGGVGDELAHLLLALVPRVQRGLHVREQGVEGGADLADLGVLVGQPVGHPLGELDVTGGQRQLGHGVRGRGHLAQRPQLPTYQDQPRARGGRDAEHPDEDLPEDELRHGAVDRGGGQPDDDQPLLGVLGRDAVLPEPRHLDVVAVPVRGHRCQRFGGRGVDGLEAVLGVDRRRGAAGRGDAQQDVEPGAVEGPVVRVPVAGAAERCAALDLVGRLTQGGLDVAVQPVGQVRAQGERRSRRDQQRDDGDQQDRGGDQARREGGEAVHEAGLSTYPAPRMVWIIGSRPASIFLRR
jgi:hypothetical protein